MKQKSILEIDEEATEAAVVTYIEYVPVSSDGGTYREEVPIVKFDRPFLFAIFNPKAKIILFAGIVSKPSI